MRNICFLLLILTISGCNHDNDYFNELDNPNNIFNIKKTTNKLDGHHIYAIDRPYLGTFSSFTESNFFLIDEGRVMNIFINEDCDKEYSTGDYIIIKKFKDLKNVKKLTPCNIILSPLLDFSLKEGDSLNYLKNYVIYNQKIFFDPNLNDSIYKFCRKWNSKTYSTVIFAAKAKGIIGIYDSIDKKEEVIEACGLIYREANIQKLKLLKPDINLNLIREFR
ncbi:hypothetical protein [Flavobacterium sp. NRK1]|uniref:hypothetical protein n=1 Tax=Flavobacterium sp. NRK1 TaxID=2954929 RepID=UPI0020933DDD|nr:hypothetical protein [Flavobacterium sp. NRK1]MCO6147933.1 hypothetical protein [Flavobacterium sp. NRK1]